MKIVDKEVNFYLYYESCKHRDKKETDEPVNTNTSKPVKWEEKK